MTTLPTSTERKLGLVIDFDTRSRTFPGLTRDLDQRRMAHRGPGSSPGKCGVSYGEGWE